jgi:hypothetical protein
MNGIGRFWIGALAAVVSGLSSPVLAQNQAHPSLGGSSGLFNVPTANVLSDGTFDFGYNVIDREWAYEGRGAIDNRIWFLSMGFLPRVEVTVRATVLPGESLLEEVPVDAVDRMASARLQVLREGRWSPAFAVGIEDLKGTRRFHSLYGVASRSVFREGIPVRAQISAGYGLRSIDAARYLLDGGFGGVELQFPHGISGIAEYDSEKWNAGLRLSLLSRVDFRLVFLNLDTISGGLSLRHRF